MTDISGHNHALLELRSNPSISVLVQDINVTNKQGESSTVYGAVVEVFHSVLNPHETDRVQKVQFTINYDYHKDFDVIDVHTMSKYVMSYPSLG